MKRLFHGYIHLTGIHGHALSQIEISKPTDVFNIVVRMDVEYFK